MNNANCLQFFDHRCIRINLFHFRLTLNLCNPSDWNINSKTIIIMSVQLLDSKHFNTFCYCFSTKKKEKKKEKRNNQRSDQHKEKKTWTQTNNENQTKSIEAKVKNANECRDGGKGWLDLFYGSCGMARPWLVVGEWQGM